ncbi:MAG: ATP-binding cassette domain-containing protein [bacterium]|nr:ATP-binding cassette domain-containing protein [bacterium]
MTSTTPLYTIKDLKYYYGNRLVLDIPELELAPGSSTGFVGPNGCGKSTLLKLLSFVEQPEKGTILFNGQETKNNLGPLRKKVTLLLQEPVLLKRSVYENIAYGLKVRGDKTNMRMRVYESLDIVGLSPGQFAHRKWNELSGGEAQRVSLASRFLLTPSVLLLDEPTASVDTLSASLIKQAIITFREQYNTSLLIASHDLIWLNEVTDEISKLYEGKIVGSGRENLIHGPWIYETDSLWVKELSDGQQIRVPDLPEKDAVVILNPPDIMITLEKPKDISALNTLQGVITRMITSTEPGKVHLDVDIAEMTLTSDVTHYSAESLQLLPGKPVWVVFKASSFHLQ